MANSRSVTETLNGSYMFTIQDYSVVTKGIGFGNHISGELTAGGHKWAIYFYPDGMHRSTYVSLIIVLKSEATDVRAHLEVTVIDRSGNGNNRNRYNFRKPPYTFKQRDSHWGYRRFFKASVLETSDYLRDDCLRIYVTVGVVISTLHSDFAIENMEGSDITFNVSGEKFHPHKSTLAARSTTKFRSEFLQGVGVEGEEVMVQDIEPNVFKALLNFIYKDALAESELITSASCSAPLVADTLTTAKLLAAADRYDLKRLKSICESHLCKDISVNSVAHLKVREMGSGSNLFVVQGYSMVKDIGVRKYIASHEFTMGGCKWVPYFYPNGRSKETSAYLSLILSLKSRAEDGCSRDIRVHSDGPEREW